MPKDYPDHHDAELILKLYELRRDPVMRESRAAMNAWFPKTFDDVMALTKPDHPQNAAFRQVSGFWASSFWRTSRSFTTYRSTGSFPRPCPASRWTSSR